MMIEMSCLSKVAEKNLREMKDIRNAVAALLDSRKRCEIFIGPQGSIKVHESGISSVCDGAVSFCYSKDVKEVIAKALHERYHVLEKELLSAAADDLKEAVV